MVHIVVSHMWKHPNANNVILHHQHGSPAGSGLSCQTQLVEAVRN